MAVLHIAVIAAIMYAKMDQEVQVADAKNSHLTHLQKTDVYNKIDMQCGRSSVGRVSAFQADCREFESRRPLHKEVSQKWDFFIRMTQTRTRRFEFGASEQSA